MAAHPLLHDRASCSSVRRDRPPDVSMDRDQAGCPRTGQREAARTIRRVGRRAAAILGAVTVTACSAGPPPSTVVDVAPSGEVASDPTPVDGLPPALLVGSDFGDDRLLVLDGAGAILGRGHGDQTLGRASLCPTGRMLAELASSPEGLPVVAIRDLTTLDIVREIEPLRGDLQRAWVQDVACLDPAGAAPVLAVEFEDSDFRSGIVRAGSDPGVIAEGQFRAWFIGDHAVLSPFKGAGPVELLDLGSGSARVLYQLGAGSDVLGDLHTVAKSPSGDRVAIVDWVSGPEHVHTLRVVGLPGGTPLLEKAFPGHSGSTTAWWVDDDTLAVVFLGDEGSEQDPIWGTVELLDADTGAETDRWQGLTILPQLVADGVFVGTPLTPLPGVLAIVSVTGGEAQVIGPFEVAPVQGVHGPIDAPVTALAALPGFDGDLLLDRTMGAPLSAVDQGSPPLLLLIGSFVIGLAVLTVLGRSATRRRSRSAAGPAAVAHGADPAPSFTTGRSGEPVAEWSLWLAGLGGTVAWTLLVVGTSAMVHADYGPGGGPSALDGLVVGLPPAICILAVVAALMLGRGLRWSIAVGRATAGLLILGLPLAGLQTVASVDPLITRHVAGLGAFAVAGEGTVIVLPQVILGVLALWGLRRPRPVGYPTGGARLPSMPLRVAGLLTVAVGVGPGLALAAIVASPAGRSADTRDTFTALLLATAAGTLLAIGIGVGRGILRLQRWAVPAALPAILSLSMTSAAVAFVATAQMATTGHSHAGPSAGTAIVPLAVAISILVAGIASLGAVLAARERFIYR